MNTILLVLVAIVAIRPIYKISKHLYLRISFHIIENQCFAYSISEELLHEEAKFHNTLEYKIQNALRKGSAVSYEERMSMTPKGINLMYKFTESRINLLLSWQCSKNRAELIMLLPCIKDKAIAEKVLVFISNRTLCSKVIWYLSEKIKALK